MVPPVSHRVSRVPWYSGSSPLEIDFRLPGSHRLWQAFPGLSANQFPLLDCPQPQRINPLVWPLPRSLATTSGISVDFSSSPYLDVSVQAVPHLRLFDSTQVDRVLLCRVSPFGNLRINGHLHLPEAYRSLSRPSSAPDAKAFPLRSFALDLIVTKCRLSWRPPSAVSSPRCPTLRSQRRSRSGSQAFELCRLRVLRNCFVLPFSKSSTNHFCFPLLLALHTWLLCSVFKVRFQLPFETRSKHLNFKCLYPTSKFSTMKFLWPTFFFQKKVGGPKWTRTTDLTIISRAL